MGSPERENPVSSEPPAERNIRTEMERFKIARVGFNDEQAQMERLRLAVELVRVRQLMREEAQEPYLNFDVIGD